MKLDELSVIDTRIDELSVGQAAGKVVGGAAKGIGAVAGGLAGIGSAFKKGYQSGKKTVGGDDDALPAQSQTGTSGGTATTGTATTGTAGGAATTGTATIGTSGGTTPAAGTAGSTTPAAGTATAKNTESPQDADAVTTLQNRIAKLDTTSQRDVFKTLQSMAKKAPDSGQEQQPTADQPQDAAKTPAADAQQQKEWPQGVDKFNAITGKKFTSPEQAQDPQYLQDKEAESNKLAQAGAERDKANAQQNQTTTANFGQGGYGQTTTNAPAGITPQQPNPTAQPAAAPAEQPAQTTQTNQPAAQQTTQPPAGKGGAQAKKVDPKLRDKTTGRYTKDHTADAGWDKNVSQFGDSKNNSKKSITESKKPFSLFRKYIITEQSSLSQGAADGKAFANKVLSPSQWGLLDKQGAADGKAFANKILDPSQWFGSNEPTAGKDGASNGIDLGNRPPHEVRRNLDNISKGQIFATEKSTAKLFYDQIKSGKYQPAVDRESTLSVLKKVIDGNQLSKNEAELIGKLKTAAKL